MAALVQSYPQQSGTVTMLQTRSTSSQGQSGQQYGGLPQQRNGYHAVPGAPLVYRGSSAPIQPYAFTSTPSLNPSAQWQQFSAYRTSSTPAVPTMQSFDGNNGSGRSRYPASASMSNLPIIQSSASLATSGSRDDSSLPPMGRRVTPAPRPQSSYMASSSTQLAFPPPQAAPARPSPERYRRPQPRSAEAPVMGQQTYHQSAMPSGSGMATVNHLYNTPRKLSPSLPNRPNSYYGNVPGSAVDDISLHRQQSQEAKRIRRRSMPALDSADYPNPLTPPDLRQPEESSRLGQLTPPETTDKEQIKTARIVSISAAGANAMHARNGSSESLVSSRSSHSRPSSSANRNTNVSTPTGNPAQLSTLADQNSSTQDYPKLVNIPPRSSSSDAAKRIANPSPLSKPVTMEGESETAGSVAANGAATPTPSAPPAASPTNHHTESPAVKQLAAISQKGGKLKSKTSRLRRAFSFGSAAELRNAGVTQDNGDASGQGPSKLHKEPTPEELYDAEQARIAQQQEAAGIGNSIYGAKLFSGSTDNLSISSTASSASIMIRKMGRGMKKGGRSLVGLFRPKSVIGVPPADAPLPEVSQAAVSMITVEAERERVNVNADPHSQNGGGTGFPRLERNSIDASKAPSLGSERLGSSGTDNSGARKSIVGGEKERAEVLAAVRKGILKNTSGSSSPSARPVDSRNPTFDLPAVPHITDSPNSSAPSTPTEEAQGHRRTGSVAIGSEDYFMTALRLRQDTKSAPATPQGTLKRNATFSPRIVFYDTWPSQEYDRRGEIATCNRLTPMLAQQIKEELNTFKMEMEVHENSKIYTHFF